jgi:hypothetical protein
MTSVLEVMAALRSEERRAIPAAVPVPAASEEGIKLALKLRDIATTNGARVVLFVPASRQTDAAPVVAEAACALLDLHDGPVLIMDVRDDAASAGSPEWITALADDDQLRLMWGAEASSETAALLRPLSGRSNRLQYASSQQFVDHVEEVRGRYRYVLCIGEATPGAVATMRIAGLADGVVLSVPPGRTTRSEMHEVTAQLRRARATLVGFVVDSRGVTRKDER